MVRSFEIPPAALTEAEAAVRYYAERNAKAGIAFAEELDAVIGEIERQPHTFLKHVHGTRRVLLRSFPFSIVYRVDEQTSLIVAAAHGSRRPGYWAERLSG